MKKKIFVMAYIRNNLGDDLFINILANRYPHIQFYLNVKDEYKNTFADIKNINYTEKMKENFEEIEVNDYDGYIYIGGSIFMENGKVYNLDEGCYDFMRKCKKNNKPFYYISCNYGPYKTQGYFQLSKETFKECTDICFRDKASYNLFKELNSVRYSPDVAFLYDVGNLQKEKGTIGISMIDLKVRDDLKDKEEAHTKILIESIKEYIKNGKKVYLFSFCLHEGDEEAISKLLNEIEEKNIKDNIEIVKYQGDIKNFLEKYKKMEYMICQRFHSVILSNIYEQKIITLSYSKKINNVIDELNLNTKCLDIKKLSGKEQISLEDFKKTDKEIINKIKNTAKKQFEKVDDFLN